MGNIYCSNCGTKHALGSKFCTNCGNSLGGFANLNKPVIKSQLQNKRSVDVSESEYDDEGIPTVFKKPTKLDYDIEKSNNKYSAKDLFTASPISDNDKTQRKVVNAKKLTKEEFLAQSLKECSSRGIQDIDES